MTGLYDLAKSQEVERAQGDPGDSLFVTVWFEDGKSLRAFLDSVQTARPARLNSWGLDALTLRDVVAWVLYANAVLTGWTGLDYDTIESVSLLVPRWFIEPREIMDMAAAPLVMSTGEAVPITKPFPSVLESMTAGLVNWTI